MCNQGITDVPCANHSSSSSNEAIIQIFSIIFTVQDSIRKRTIHLDSRWKLATSSVSFLMI